MIEAVVTGLIYLCLLVLAVYLVLWVIQSLGVSLPDMVVKIIWIIVALIAVLILVRVLLPGLGLGRLGELEPLLRLLA